MSKKSKSKEAKISAMSFAVILLIAGFLFLIGSFVPLLSIGKLWPLFMLIPVVFMVNAWIIQKKEASGVIFPVILLTYYAGYFLWLNFVGWENTATTWPNFLLGPGLAFIGLFFTTREWGVLIPAGILLVLATIFFAANVKANVIIALILILFGVMILLKSIFFPEKRNKKIPDDKEEKQEEDTQ
jgi:hypothetical protein